MADVFDLRTRLQRSLEETPVPPTTNDVLSGSAQIHDRAAVICALIDGDIARIRNDLMRLAGMLCELERVLRVSADAVRAGRDPSVKPVQE